MDGNFKNNSIMTILQGLDEGTLIQVWNEYCSINGNMEDYIYDNEEYEVNEALHNQNPFDVLTGIDKYDLGDKYFVMGIYGIKSFDDVNDIIELSDLVRAIIINESILMNVTNEADWEDVLYDGFSEYLTSLDIPADVNYKYEVSVRDLLVMDWLDVLDELCDEEEQ